MEGLAPPLKCLIEIQSSVLNGESVRSGVHKYLETQKRIRGRRVFSDQVRNFLFAWDQGQDWRAVICELKSPHRRALLEIIASGLAGQPIANHLEQLREELLDASDMEIRHHLELLPLKMLMPLLFFQFPAFLLLLFGPLLRQLVEEMNR